ncbi:MAG: hypothetical protein ACI9UJ_001811 [bacterium]|jgi:hypothetical protein
MRLLRPLMFTALSVLFVYYPSACPTYYVTLSAYVQHSGVNFTNTELKKLNLSDIKDTSDMAIPDKEVTGFYAEFSGIGHVEHTAIGYANQYNLEEEISIQKSFELMMDSMMPRLNLGDSLFLRYYLSNSKIKYASAEEEFFRGGFEKFLINSTYIISSQAVVDLKRSPEDAGMTAYPSPAKSEVSVKFEVKEPIAGHITILNTLGQIIAEVDHENLMQPYTFNISEEAAGTYFIRTKIDGEYFTKKFVKE